MQNVLYCLIEILATFAQISPLHPHSLNVTQRSKLLLNDSPSLTLILVVKHPVETNKLQVGRKLNVFKRTTTFIPKKG